MAQINPLLPPPLKLFYALARRKAAQRGRGRGRGGGVRAFCIQRRRLDMLKCVSPWMGGYHRANLTPNKAMTYHVLTKGAAVTMGVIARRRAVPKGAKSPL